ncbi:hypothetical protein BS47DRAFT_1448085 [Hydnum rufescens UP504]|uniref:Uncharacterized protein n=1 Tax=Hydnum rufescens UP504 TaxID=1448309 RepID=A0A9P6B127_9AGAM|nr:hypothetical protein BS47DRAFT_1448085 [Hydnum rufescens UP504]
MNLWIPSTVRVYSVKSTATFIEVAVDDFTLYALTVEGIHGFPRDCVAHTGSINLKRMLFPRSECGFCPPGLNAANPTPEDQHRLAIVVYLSSPSTSFAKEDWVEIEGKPQNARSLNYVKRRSKNARHKPIGHTHYNPGKWARSGRGALQGIQSLNRPTKGGSDSLLSGVKNFLPADKLLPVTRVVEAVAIMDPANASTASLQTTDNYLLLIPKSPRSSGSKPRRMNLNEGVIFMIGGGGYVEYTNIAAWANKSSTSSLLEACMLPPGILDSLRTVLQVMVWSQVPNDEARPARAHMATHQTKCNTTRMQEAATRRPSSYVNHTPTAASVWFSNAIATNEDRWSEPPLPEGYRLNHPPTESRKRDLPRNLRQTKPGNGSTRHKPAGTPDEPPTRFCGCVVISRFSSEPTTPNQYL